MAVRPCSLAGHRFFWTEAGAKGGTEKGQNFGVTYKIPIAAFRSVRRCQEHVSHVLIVLPCSIWQKPCGPNHLNCLHGLFPLSAPRPFCYKCSSRDVQWVSMSINEWPTHETYWNLRKWHKMANSSWFCPFFLGVHSIAVSSVRNQALGTPSARLWEDFWGQSWCGKHSLMGGGGS
jgi:hypothetical protein